MLPLSRRLPRLPLPALALLLPLCAGELAGQDGAATLIARATAAETGAPLQGAQVLVQGMGIGGITDSNGVAWMEGLPLGARTVEVRYLGYAPASAVLLLTGGDPTTAFFDLEVQPIELAEVRVRARRSPLHTNGFYERQGTGFGTFITREEIQEMRPRFLSDVLRRVAGIHLTPGGFGGTSRAMMRGTKVLGACPIQYYLDGTLTALFNIDEVQPDDVEGLEIYRGAATIPPVFNKGTAMCGVVVIWTRLN